MKENLLTNSSRIEIPSSIEINSETYFLYFIRVDDIIRGKVFFNDPRGSGSTKMNLFKILINPV